MRKNIKRLGLIISVPFFIVLLYLTAALIGGLVPANKTVINGAQTPLEPSVYLTANALHADIAIPVTDLTREQFSFLRDAGFPLDNPNLHYLIIGWGSREFYTSTANYSDMEFGTIWQAVTGDRSVMHVAPGGDISKSQGAIKLTMTEQGFANLLEFMMESFDVGAGKPVLLPNATFGYGDLFYEARGYFNIFNPCNVWVSKALKEAGLSSGVWTPTTYSLTIHQWIYN